LNMASNFHHYELNTYGTKLSWNILLIEDFEKVKHPLFN
jgi:hypothetical protein